MMKQKYEDGYAAGHRDRWISVDDTLPKHTGDVLVFVGINKLGEGMHNETRVANYNTVFQKFTVHESYNTLIGDVTHWMPLPEQPEVEK